MQVKQKKQAPRKVQLRSLAATTSLTPAAVLFVLLLFVLLLFVLLLFVLLLVSHSGTVQKPAAPRALPSATLAPNLHPTRCMHSSLSEGQMEGARDARDEGGARE